ncbi:tyrosine-type recombinase/integrase [Fulvivirga lutea]|uniref:Tyrosine-type recombinase/integrase n=1 Tax=Fulvivirga lutea TaxID=2810512 RepID=A0A974WGA1_9BACT|nr:tyrosine-type recombinase/integrase [Fulvivirga lutea]QSE96512.1 tyrosine-type recombinase/integrase [Fulvivirga lutea]
MLRWNHFPFFIFLSPLSSNLVFPSFQIGEKYIKYHFLTVYLKCGTIIYFKLAKMSVGQTACSPLDWDREFQKLLKELSVAIHEAEGERKVTLARYQTAIAIGGYLGPRAKELLHFTWFDFLGKSEKDVYEFKTEKNRKIYFNEKLLKLISANYKIIDPNNVHDFILESPKHPGKPISTRAFNKAFKKVLENYNVITDNPSSHTLRKTFAYRVFDNKGKDEQALIFVGEVLGHSSIDYTRKYLGIKRNQIKEAYLSIH